MFKRSEKKIKAVFKMQFQATQVPQLKAKSLMISLVPVDVGKPTVRLAKAPILEGTCTWANPIYETVKLIKEIKTGRIREKFYYVVVSTGSSKSGFLGEVSIDFADLAGATKPLNLTLPLQTSKSGAILHVTVQNMRGGSDSRDDEDSETQGDESYDGKRNPKSPESDDLSEATSLHDEQNGSLDDPESDNNGMFGRSTNQMKMLERKVELSELEVQSLRTQIAKETKRAQQLSEQIVCVKEERDALKAECEQLKSSSTCNNEGAVSSHGQKETENLRSSLENIKQELQREKQLNKKLKLQLQKTEDSNSEFVLAMRDLSKKLEQKNAEISRLTGKIKALHNGSEAVAASPKTKPDTTDEAETLKQKIENLYSEIEVLKKEKEEIQMQVERLTLDYESLDMENQDIYAKLEQNEKEKMEIQQTYTESLATVKQFKARVASLEAENKRQTRQYSESLNTIDELEFQVDNLHKELEKQTQDFEEDLQAITELKVEQEKRAIRAEEALRKTRLSNANAAEQVQEEFKQISAEMSMKIEENEKLAKKAVTEANDLQQKNEVLEDMLQKAKKELRIVRGQYEETLQERQLQKEGIAESNQKSEMAESEMLNRWKSENEDLERQLASVRREAESLMKENNSMKSQIDQKKTKEENLHLEVKKLRLKNNEVRNQLVQLELEREGLQKEMSKLQGTLRKKEQETLPGRKTGVEMRVLEDLSVQKSSQSDGGDVSSLLSEVASLKERNKSMEEQLKEMHERYSEISLRFAEVEGERQQLVMALRNVKGGKKN
ncbi:E3 ubiquitin ligase involved in syntaxin degradation [Handroanthus impetiginosus]|uniref:E3 ubiquitin ligase involved in syntaxin degradation n=1 Tax=Handroanthus impetiginosus TaxID=429701 RepID=A0A2G9HI13_9LAMI|nr:E3 ubiquitin ligase involved in syntaxin degradation [Handroanthus impetiginosus]